MPGRRIGRFDGGLEDSGPGLVGLAEPFRVLALGGRSIPLVAAEGGGGGAIDVRLLGTGATIDLRDEGVPVREGVEDPDERAEPSCFVGDLLELCQSFVSTKHTHER